MENATLLQELGAAGFGFLIGWNLYFVNRYRKGDVSLSDLAALVGAIGGTAVLALFPARTDLFGAYGIGLFLGFAAYLVMLVVLVARSDNFDWDWFLDGRRRQVRPDQRQDDTGGRAMGQEGPGLRD
ncbi:MAG: hypothetical protein ACR2MO_07960 [Acidimicrobiales bacterium]